MSKAFVAFGPSHLAAIGLSFLLPLALGLFTRGAVRERIARTICLVFATLLIATWGAWYWLIASRGWVSAETLLPIQLCDWAGFAAIAALILRSERAYELGYFWSLSGTLQALLTPELFHDFPDLRFIVFFAFHGGVIASVLYLTFAYGMRPKPSSLPRVALWSLGYFVTALAANKLFGTNFGYLSAKPAKASLLDLMAQWPYYLIELVALGVIYILVLYAPFFVVDMLRARRAAAGRVRR
jgi:hypothetical integral membrane protein (TIGR02206 family)